MLIQKLLIIGTVWPEPNSTAAGNRMLQIIEQFAIHIFEIVFASAANDSDFMFDLEIVNVKKVSIELNNSSFDDFLLKLNPNFVIFDRFMIEEQFGWRVSENCPNAIRILDTEDLHFVRQTRFENFKKNKETTSSDFFESEIGKREIASIYRCDLSLIISEFEIDILQNVFKIGHSILYYLPFLLNRITVDATKSNPTFTERNHFVTIGNFRHEPNWNSVLYLKQEIWPLIKSKLPNAELHVYGSYVTEKAMQLHNAKEGFLIKGRAENAHEIVKTAKIMLAPIRFGAGLKGKFIDAMQSGTPVITTTIGAEGMNGTMEWNGFIEDCPEKIANAAIELFLNQSKWENAQRNGYEIINNRFDKSIFGTNFMKQILNLQKDIVNHRKFNFIGQILQTDGMKSTKYMSKWIEEKNKKIGF